MQEIKQKAREAFKVFSTPYDPAGDNWSDMDAEAFFVAGFSAALAASSAPAQGEQAESSAWAAFWISDEARGHKYADMQVGFHAGWQAAIAAPAQGGVNVSEIAGEIALDVTHAIFGGPRSIVTEKVLAIVTPALRRALGQEEAGRVV